jgi:DNA-binding response OmpR family regulator
MISAKQLPEDRKKGFLAGIDDFMTKPIDPEEMMLHVKALLRRSKIVSERKINIGEVVLDYDSYTVSGHGETVELPQKEFLLLYKLLSYPNKIFTRIQLMDEIWGYECDTGPETVTVHIGRLRKRFENFSEFEIVSIRGLGYKAVKNV